MRTIDVEVRAPVARYPVHVEAGALARLPRRLAELAPAGAWALIADASVVATWADPLAAALRAAGHKLTLHVHETGEAAKTRQTWLRLTDELLNAGLGRDGGILAVGGGVTGDLAGIVAATYMRGIGSVLVPTSLLAMVDASVGGKTGVDTPAGKNLVGAFHAPRLVCIDPLVLRTLPDDELRSGFAEVIKHGAIADADYAADTLTGAGALWERDLDALTACIARSVTIKAAIVRADPREQGERAVLNFGHTFAHGLEVVHRYRLRHGHAVAIGMVLAARVGERVGVTVRGTAEVLETTLRAFQLPVQPPPGSTAELVLPAMQRDKKVRDGRIRLVLLERIGAVARDAGAWTFAVPESLIAEELVRATPATV